MVKYCISLQPARFRQAVKLILTLDLVPGFERGALAARNSFTGMFLWITTSVPSLSERAEVALGKDPSAGLQYGGTCGWDRRRPH